jgi:hypothetical protein
VKSPRAANGTSGRRRSRVCRSAWAAGGARREGEREGGERPARRVRAHSLTLCHFTHRGSSLSGGVADTAMSTANTLRCKQRDGGLSM